MKLIVGLGNYGKEYQNTRHNIGFLFLDYFCSKENIKLTTNKFNSVYFKGIIYDEDVIILKPLTYMNLSGEAVIKVINYFKIDLNDILIIYDDKDLNLNEYRLRIKGSSGGQNGIKNIISHLKTDSFPRLKIGIGKPKPNIDTSDYVLSNMSKTELNNHISNMEIYRNIVKDFIKKDFLYISSKYNGKIKK